MAIAREVVIACRLGVEVLIIAFNHIFIASFHLFTSSYIVYYNITGGNRCWRS